MIVCAALLFVPVLLKSRTSRDSHARAAFTVLSEGRIAVKVGGDLRHPGVYEVPANSLAISVINMAVPLRPVQQITGNSAARPLLNGSAITLTAQPDGSHLLTTDRMTVPERLAMKIPLDIATMDESDFDRLPGIGPALAKRIAEYRQKNGGTLRVSDLVAIEGIGDKKYKKLQAYFQHP